MRNPSPFVELSTPQQAKMYTTCKLNFAKQALENQKIIELNSRNMNKLDSNIMGGNRKPTPQIKPLMHPNTRYATINNSRPSSSPLMQNNQQIMTSKYKQVTLLKNSDGFHEETDADSRSINTRHTKVTC